MFSGREPIPWATRVQIALDSARGLEYIHEHTVPVYIHRDIKSANILIDENFRAKVNRLNFPFYQILKCSNNNFKWNTMYKTALANPHHVEKPLYIKITLLSVS